MPQLVVNYTFRPLVWSDGTPVTAADSVYSFEVARDRLTPRPDAQARYTAAYEATGERSLRWTGLPGYLDPAFMTHVWPPLPQHQLGDFTPAELPALDEAARAPLSYGAFVVESWTAGESIRLVPNPHYDRAAEGLPHLTSLTFRFLAERPRALPEGYEAVSYTHLDVYKRQALPAPLRLLGEERVVHRPVGVLLPGATGGHGRGPRLGVNACLLYTSRCV